MKVTARVQRSGDWWAVEVPEVPGVFTQTRRLDQVGDMVADAVSTMLDGVAAADVDVTVEPLLSADLEAAVREARIRTLEARQSAEEASRAMRAAVRALRRSEHLSVRDAAKILGVTHQRVSQLEKDHVKS